MLTRRFCMDMLVDDIGSFPLPTRVNRGLFDNAYVQARRAIITGKSIKQDDFLMNNFYQVITESFRRKCATGLDIANYPQHFDMYKQVTDAISKAMDKGTYMVDERDAIIPEVHVINEEAKRLSEELRKKISLRVCVTGPLELYLKMIGTVPYMDILLMFAETVRRFARNSILDTKYIKTEVVSLDEPSFGFQEVSGDKDVILDVLEKAFDFADVKRQIHLHSSARIANLLEIKNLDVLSFEFGASPKNIESLPKRMLDKTDKQVRVGIARTDIDAINAELRDRGVTKPNSEQIVESVEVIRKRFRIVKEKYGDRMTFTGPDCGLGGWPTQESAQLLLKRTVEAVKSKKINSS
jgi:5-methyltetrahydropteroyltriglutamate--homocysteine methyltransferase